MKRNRLKKICVLLLALILCTVSTMPVVAKAASRITLKSDAQAPSTIYAGHSYMLKVSGVKVKFYSSNKEIATIGMITGKLMAIAPGTVTITAKNVKSGKAVAKKTFKVLQRAESVTADSEIYLSNVGDTATIKATKTPATSTDVVRFASSDKRIATVGATSGKVTAKEEGKTTIKVYSKATSRTANSSKNNKVATVDIYVGPCIDTVKQLSVNKVEIIFKSDIKEVKTVDINITSNSTKAVYAVAKVTTDKNDAKRVIVSTYATLPFSDEMTLTYKKTSGCFTTTDGKIATIKIKPLSITCGREVPMYYDACDSNGIIIDENKPLTSSVSYDCNLEVTSGYTNDYKAYANSLSSTVKARVVYHTYKYENGNEVGVIDTGDVVIKVEEEVLSSDTLNYTIADTNANVDFNASSFKQDTDISVEEGNKSVHFQFLNSNGVEVADYSKYKVQSSNSSVLYVRGELSNTNKKLEIVAFNEGTAYLLIKDTETMKDIAALPITVKEKRKPVSIKIDKYTFNVAQSIAKMPVESFTINLLDQYGEIMPEELLLMSQFSITEKNDSNGKLEDCISLNKNNVTLYTSNRSEGSYVFKINYEKLPEKYITVSYKKPTGAESYHLMLQYPDSAASMTESVKEITIVDDSPVILNVNISTLKGSIFVNSQNIKETKAKITIYNENGQDVTSSYYSEGKFKIQSNENGLINTLPQGTYKIIARLTDASNRNYTATNTVKITINKKSTTERPEKEEVPPFVGPVEDFLPVIN